MGATCNPKPQPLIPPRKQALQLSCKRLKHHFEIKQNKINQEIINGESFLVRKISEDANRRNKVEELLLAQRIVNGLKYSAVYTLLLEYSISVGNFANFICENIDDQQKLDPWKHKLYSLLYAALKMRNFLNNQALSTLDDFKNTMLYIYNEIFIQQYADQQIKNYLKPHPTPEQMNIYFLQMSQRNNISIEKINLAGHSFSPNFRQSNLDNQFQNKSQQYRDSLPKQSVLGNNYNNDSNKGKSSFNPRASVSNPFDHNKSIDPNSKKVESNNESLGDKVDENDISPNITDLMKKIGSSKFSP